MSGLYWTSSGRGKTSSQGKRIERRASPKFGSVENFWGLMKLGGVAMDITDCHLFLFNSLPFSSYLYSKKRLISQVRLGGEPKVKPLSGCGCQRYGRRRLSRLVLGISERTISHSIALYRVSRVSTAICLSPISASLELEPVNWITHNQFGNYIGNSFFRAITESSY